MHRGSTRANQRHLLFALLRAGLLAGAGLLILAWPASAAGPSLQPSASPDATAAPDSSPSPDPTPTAEPTAQPTPTPTPAPLPTPTPGATPTPGPTPTPPPGSTIESRLVYRAAAITRQYRNYWCVPASTQTMWNLVKKVTNRTVLRQGTLYKQIRAHNRYRYPTLGNDVEGWAWGLRRWTAHPYQAKSYASRTQAIGAIVEAIKRTGDPVGIAVKSGSHAWVVLGYKVRVEVADPTKRTILGLYVTGPLGVGRDPFPYRYLTIAQFEAVYTRYHERTRHVIWEGRYVMVVD